MVSENVIKKITKLGSILRVWKALLKMYFDFLLGIREEECGNDWVNDEEILKILDGLDREFPGIGNSALTDTRGEECENKLGDKLGRSIVVIGIIFFIVIHLILIITLWK